VISLAENDKLTELVSSTEDDMKNLYVSDASDSHLPVWSSAAYWPALQLSPRFREATRKEIRFYTKFFMSNGAKSLFSRCPHFEMAAFLLNT
jgi:hypothetical protein